MGLSHSQLGAEDGEEQRGLVQWQEILSLVLFPRFDCYLGSTKVQLPTGGPQFCKVDLSFYLYFHS